MQTKLLPVTDMKPRKRHSCIHVHPRTNGNIHMQTQVMQLVDMESCNTGHVFFDTYPIHQQRCAHADQSTAGPGHGAPEEAFMHT